MRLTVLKRRGENRKAINFRCLWKPIL